MSRLKQSLHSEFERLRQQGGQLTSAGRLDEARSTYLEAKALAEQLQDSELVDLMICNLAAISISYGPDEKTVRELQMVLMRSSSQLNRHLAAYNISHLYDLQSRSAQRLRYARLALQYAEQLENPAMVARGHNLVANMLLIDSYFEEAGQHYRSALELTSTQTDGSHSMGELACGYILANLGYCNLATGQIPEGFEALFRALRLWRRLDIPADSMGRRAHLSLCYGYLEIDRVERARRHGETALALAESYQDTDTLRKALYLLGDAEKAAGNDYIAFEHFDRLQREFHSDSPELANLLMATDSRQLINLMA